MRKSLAKYPDLRLYRSTDLHSVAQIYRTSIQDLGSQHYSAKQVAAWSSFPEDLESFAAWLESAKTFVAVEPSDIAVGFGGIQENGRISSLFVAPTEMRKGIGSAILSCLIAEAQFRKLQTLSTEASEFSRPVFEKFGFTVSEIENIQFKGVAFTRYVMHAHI